MWRPPRMLNGKSQLSVVVVLAGNGPQPTQAPVSPSNWMLASTLCGELPALWLRMAALK